MRTLPSIHGKASSMKNHSLWSLLCALVLAVTVAAPVPAVGAVPQETFATPEAAADALMAALKADSNAPLAALFGEEHLGKIIDPDAAAAKATRAQIVGAMQTLRV